MPPRTEYAQIDSREVAYQLFGEGDAEVVYVWGNISHLDWYWSDPDLTHMLRRVSARARVMYDRSGVGMSDPVAEPPDLSERAAELATLIEHVGFVRPHLVGAVEGCATVVYLAATQPDKVGRIQLFAPWICGSGRHPWSISEEAYRPWLDAAANWGEGSPSICCSRAWLVRRFTDVLTNMDASPLLRSISAPTLVMANSHDPVISPAGFHAEPPGAASHPLSSADPGRRSCGSSAVPTPSTHRLGLLDLVGWV